MNQVNLAQIWVGGVSCHPGAMLDSLAHMRVSLDAQASNKLDAVLILLAESMAAARANGNDLTNHICDYLQETVVCSHIDCSGFAQRIRTCPSKV
jgi:hypothetical protein